MTTWIHCGFHKTGSTSIQRHGAADGFSGVAFLPDSYSGLLPTGADPDLVSEVAALATRGAPVLLSSEGALGTSATGYSEAVGRCRALLHTFRDVDPHVVLFVRPFHDWVESAYVQHVQQGGTEDPASFLARVIEGRPAEGFWSGLMTELTECTGDRLHVVPTAPGHDAVRQLATLLGGDSSAEARARRFNVSIRAEEALLMRQLNAALPAEARGQVRKFLQRRTSTSTPRSDGMSVLDGARQAALLDASLADWTEVGSHVEAAFRSDHGSIMARLRAAEVRPTAPGPDPGTVETMLPFVMAAVEPAGPRAPLPRTRRRGVVRRVARALARG